MVSRDAAKRVLAKTLVEAGLTGKPQAWFLGWGEQWVGPWMRGREYTERSITVMARNAAAHAREVFA